METAGVKWLEYDIGYNNQKGKGKLIFMEAFNRECTPERSVQWKLQLKSFFPCQHIHKDQPIILSTFIHWINKNKFGSFSTTVDEIYWGVQCEGITQLKPHSCRLHFSVMFLGLAFLLLSKEPLCIDTLKQQTEGHHLHHIQLANSVSHNKSGRRCELDLITCRLLKL